jgi:hypothetical protein
VREQNKDGVRRLVDEVMNAGHLVDGTRRGRRGTRLPCGRGRCGPSTVVEAPSPCGEGCLRQWTSASSTSTSSQWWARRPGCVAHGEIGLCVAEPGIPEDPGPSVGVQPDQVSHEVDHEQSDLRVVGDVAGAGVHPVAPVRGQHQAGVVEHVDEAGWTGAQCGVTPSAGVGGGKSKPSASRAGAATRGGPGGSRG